MNQVYHVREHVVGHCVAVVSAVVFFDHLVDFREEAFTNEFFGQVCGFRVISLEIIYVDWNQF